MHARRRFVEAMLVLNIKGLTDEQVLMLPEAQAILLIREIYLAETPLKSLSPEERLLQRKEKVLPKVNAFFEFIRTIDVSNPLTSEKLKDAVSYALNQEENLRRFLSDGNIPPDNGSALSEQITYPQLFTECVDNKASSVSKLRINLLPETA